jgi:L-alanine-DL-glutamate epimerase-like enolase superfamily enzyme
MLVDVRDETIELRPSFVTPIGTIDLVCAVTVTVGDGDRCGTGRIRCQHASRAQEIAATATDIVCTARFDEQKLDDGMSDWWSGTWRDVAARANPIELLALSGIDAAVWDLVSPPSPGSGKQDVHIYWSGFWLGDSVDAARREAARSRDLGFDAVKMRVDADDLASSVDRYNAIADELPDSMGIAIELAGAGTVDYTRQLVGDIDTRRVLWLEDPVPSTEPENTAQLAAELPVPIAGGEVCFGTDALDAYLESTGLAVPIFDLGCCGGPTALAQFLGSQTRAFHTMGIHLDALLAAHTLARVRTSRRVFLEVMDWWEHTTPTELRAILAGST